MSWHLPCHPCGSYNRIRGRKHNVIIIQDWGIFSCRINLYSYTAPARLPYYIMYKEKEAIKIIIS